MCYLRVDLSNHDTASDVTTVPNDELRIRYCMRMSLSVPEAKANKDIDTSSAKPSTVADSNNGTESDLPRFTFL